MSAFLYFKSYQKFYKFFSSKENYLVQIKKKTFNIKKKDISNIKPYGMTREDILNFLFLFLKIITVLN